MFNHFFHEPTSLKKNIVENDPRIKMTNALSVYDVTPTHDYDEVYRRIDACRTIQDFLAIYYDPFYQMCISNIESAQLGSNRLAWAEQWAKKLSNKDQAALRLNNDRRLCLRLLYAMCDCWKPKDHITTPSNVSDSDLINIFKPQKIQRILFNCLVMDRANALYNMIDRVTNQRGMHWYSHRDEALVAGWRLRFGEDRMNEPTINKRLSWLFDLKELGLSQAMSLVHLMQPCRTPLSHQHCDCCMVY